MKLFTITGNRYKLFPDFNEGKKAEEVAAFQKKWFNATIIGLFLITTLLYAFLFGRELYCKEHDAVCSTIICMATDDNDFKWYNDTRNSAIQMGWNQSLNFEIWKYSTQVNWKKVYRNCSQQFDSHALPYKIND